MLVNIVSQISQWLVPAMLLGILLLGFYRKVRVYEIFIEGAEKGITTAIKVIPFLVAMLVAISVFRASGAMELFARAVQPLLGSVGVPAEVLPLALMRPLSGSGALGMATELIKVHGPDSLIGRLASTMQGSTDTTFYVLSLYFGSVGIKHYRYSLMVGLLADIVSFLASIFIVLTVFK